MMAQSAAMAQKALEIEKSNGEILLKQAIDLGCQCFESWGLISEPMKKYIRLLKSEGAYAIKPIGSGDGGYLLCLWQSSPPVNNISPEIIINMDQIQ